MTELCDFGNFTNIQLTGTKYTQTMNNYLWNTQIFVPRVGYETTTINFALTLICSLKSLRYSCSRNLISYWLSPVLYARGIWFCNNPNNPNNP